MTSLNVLNHAPNSKADFSAISGAISQFYTCCDLPEKAATENRIYFVAGTYKVSCLATKLAVKALAERMAKHGIKEKKQGIKSESMPVEYSCGGVNHIQPIMQKAGKYTPAVIPNFPFPCIVAKGPFSSGYAVFVCGTGMTISGLDTKKASDCVAQTIERFSKLDAEKLAKLIEHVPAKIAEHTARVEAFLSN